jgi:Ca2+-binding EF-hand superfamily protein
METTMTIKAWMFGTAAAVLVAATPVLAQPAPGAENPGRHAGPGGHRDAERMGHRHGHHGLMQMFREADADSDGRLTLEELRADINRRFQAADADRDAAVTRAEFDAYMNSRMELRGDTPRAQPLRGRMDEMRARAFRVLDANADARLSLAEVQQAVELGFRMMDRNGDGVVAQDETGRRGRGEGPREGRGPGAGPQQQ